jgi:hypothetical protein
MTYHMTNFYGILFMDYSNHRGYLIIIDTDSYAGNFEREMCAYLTGQFADDHVGEDIAEEMRDSDEIKHIEWWNEHISPIEDEKGSEFYRPCDIYPTESATKTIVFRGQNIEQTEYNSVAIFTDIAPPKKVINEMIKRAKKFCENREKIYDEAGLYLPDGFDKAMNYLDIRILAPVIQEEVVTVQSFTHQEVKKLKM